jgi:hypothetical protein
MKRSGMTEQKAAPAGQETICPLFTVYLSFVSASRFR